MTTADVTGVYTLAAIDGHSLPAPFGTGTVIVYDSVWFATDGTWRDKFGGSPSGSPVVAYVATYTGTWALDANAGVVHATYYNDQNVKFVDDYRTSDRGRTFSFTGSNGTWVYQRAP